MSVKLGSSKETYKAAIEYWKERIESCKIASQEAQQDVKSAYNGLDKVLDQYYKEFIEKED